MNKIYRKVWNNALGVMVVASELARHDHGDRPRSVMVGNRTRVVAAVLTLGALLPLSMAANAGDVCQQTGDGAQPVANGPQAFACGGGAASTAANSTAIGANARASATSASAFGGNSRALAANATSLGANAIAATAASTAVGSNARAQGLHATAVGYSAQGMATGAIAIGFNSFVASEANHSVALGYGARATQANTFSVGSGGGAGSVGPATRRVVNVSAGTENTDAVNLAQLNEVGDVSQRTNRYFKADGANDGTDDAEASGAGSVAAGANAQASGSYTSAIGGEALASGNYASASGYLSEASGDGSLAYGAGSYANAYGASAVGWQASAEADGATALGSGAQALQFDTVAVGAGAQALGENSVALGGQYQGTAYTEAEGDYSTAIGGGAWSGGFSSTALGNAAQALGLNSVALGSESVAERDNSVAVGSAGSERQITDVAAGTENTDAVNLAQLNEVGDNIGDLEATVVKYDDKTKAQITLEGESGTLLTNVSRGTVAIDSTDAINAGQLFDSLDATAQHLGGGAAVTAFGTISAPAYLIQGSTYFNVGDALSALDYSVGNLDARMSSIESMSTDGAVATSADSTTKRAPAARADADRADAAEANQTQSPVSGLRRTAATPAGVAGVDGTSPAVTSNALGEGAKVSGSNSVALGAGSVADRDNTVSVGVAGSERQITNVAAGSADTDAANVAQVRAEDARTLSTAKVYTDARFNAMQDDFTAFSNSVDKRLGRQDRRIDRIGAMSTAMMQMAANAANSISERGRIAVGAGFMGGEQALSIGYGKKIGDRGSFTIGGAFSNDDQSAGVGFGLDL